MVQNSRKNDTRLSSGYLTSLGVVGCSPVLGSNYSHVQQSTVPSSFSFGYNIGEWPGTSPLNLKMETPSQRFKFQGHDSLPTQSTGQSNSEFGNVVVRNPYGQSIISDQSGHNVTHGKPFDEGLIRPTSAMGSQDIMSHPSFIDYDQSIGHIPRHYAEPNGFLAAANVPQTMFRPQLMGITPTRVPLPVDYPQGEFIYVSAKRYDAILRRRQFREKSRAKNKPLKERKPFMHESRHRHALNRVRGPGGRFLSRKELQESKTDPTPTTTTDGSSTSCSDVVRGPGGRFLSRKELQESKTDPTPTTTTDGSSTSCSDVTISSKGDDMLQGGGGNQHNISDLFR